MLVRWTKPAADDLVHICDYTEVQFGAAQARRVAIAICNGAESLATMPSRGRKGRRASTRELDLAGLPFVIVYRVKDESVEIARILHGAQQER